MKFQTWFAGAAIAAAIIGAGAAQAQCVGNCGTDGADGDVTLSPTGNSSYQFISTYQGVVGVGEIASVGAGNTGQNPNGSELTSSTFTAAAGNPLSFYFNYVTSDGSTFNDYAWVELQTTAGAHVAWLFTGRTTTSGNTSPGFGLPANDSTLSPSASPIILGTGASGGPVWSPLGPLSDGSGSCFDVGCGYTGWIKSTYTIGAAGDYKVVFGVTNFVDQAFQSGLAFDGLANAGVPIPPGGGGAVPEPATWALMLAGLGALGAMLRTARRSGLAVAA